MARGIVIACRAERDVWPGHGLAAATLVPVANRPILRHALDALAAAGVRQATVLVDGPSHRAVSSAVRGEASARVKTDVVPCVGRPEASVTALAHAFAGARDDPLVVLSGEGVFRGDLAALVARLEAESLDLIAVTPACDAVTAMPDIVVSVMRGGAQREAPASAGRAVGAPETVAALGAPGASMRVIRSAAAWQWSGAAESLLEGNRLVLDALDGGPSEARPGVQVQGRVTIDPTATIEDAIIRGPSVVGARAVVRHAYIGPYTALGDGVTIEGAEIEHSIVLHDATVKHVGRRLESSVIGSEARIVRSFAPPDAVRMHLCARSQISLA